MHMLHACMCMHVCAYEHAMPARRPSHGCTAAAWPMPGAAGSSWVGSTRELGAVVLIAVLIWAFPEVGTPEVLGLLLVALEKCDAERGAVKSGASLSR